MDSIKEILDREVEKRDIESELSSEKPDPLMVARKYRDERIALVSALFAYGKASLIVKFLENLDFSYLDKSEKEIRERYRNSYYRFQKGEDISAIFVALSRIYQNGNTLQTIFLNGYGRNHSVLEGIASLIENIYTIYPYNSKGYKFLIGKPPHLSKLSGQSPYKRWNLFLRWVVRDRGLDLGLWKGVSKRDLLIPLDTHTFHISRKLGLLDRKSYDLKSVIELTEKLKEFDPEDPIKYDFAIYRIGQEKMITL